MVGQCCEDVAESIHAMRNRLLRQYGCIRGEIAKCKAMNTCTNRLQDNVVNAAIAGRKKRSRRKFKAVR